MALKIKPLGDHVLVEPARKRKRPRRLLSAGARTWITEGKAKRYSDADPRQPWGDGGGTRQTDRQMAGAGWLKRELPALESYAV